MWALLLVRAAFAAAPDRRHEGDIRRFGLDRPEPAWRSRGGPTTPAALRRIRSLSTSGVRVRYLPQGGVAGLSGRLSGPGLGSSQEVAKAFLRENGNLLGIDPEDLVFEVSRSAGGITHLLYGQVRKGVPVEFGRVKVHISDQGEILGVDSGFVPGVPASAVSAVDSAAAAQSVARDLGMAPPSEGALVYIPLYRTGEVRLAWRFKIWGKGGRWRYYVDAGTGDVLFRYDELRRQCQTSGSVLGQVYDVDPSSTPLAARPMPNQKVFVYRTDFTTFAVTGADGSYCSATPGKIFTALQGSFIHVSHSNGLSAHYDNGDGVWFTATTPVSSPHPYPNGTASPTSSVLVATISSPSPPLVPFGAGAAVVKALPRFSFFQVGSVSVDGEPVDSDSVRILDSDGAVLASYTGSKSAFNGAAVQGLNPQIRLKLEATPSGQHQGFDVTVSSFLVLTNSPAVAGPGSTFLWTSTLTADGTLDEVNAFYHLNKIHDYFVAGVNSLSAAPISGPLSAIVHFGPNLANAFFDPDLNQLVFGDVGTWALDASVIRHEYSHFVVEQIYPLLNFSQSGAISEALADYFSASSLNNPRIGASVAGGFGSEGVLRDLACSGLSCIVFPTQWGGEIHDDSRPLSQALWEVRTGVGGACSDQLVFQSILFFPDSFQELLDAMLQVSARSSTLAPACGANNSASTIILARFGAHGISSSGGGGDLHEPNDGFQSATDLTTAAWITATIFPAADQDFYGFGAGPGIIHAALTLPSDPSNPTAHFAYGLVLLDRQLRAMAGASPHINVNPTVNGNCPLGPVPPCQTTDATVQLNFNNPSANMFYLQVTAIQTDDGSNSAVNSSLPYTLRVDYPKEAALSGTIVTASYDNDLLRFSVGVSTFVRFQNFSFFRAQLRDHGLSLLPQTNTDGSAPYLVLVSSSGGLGQLTGTARIASGFADRFPAVGTVYLEVLGLNALQVAKQTTATAFSVQSLGISNPIHLTAARSNLTAWNNVFNPLKGEKATFRYDITAPGHVNLSLYTQHGSRVLTLLDGEYPAGEGSVDWNGRSWGGNVVASGIYLLRLEAPGIRKTQKVIVVK